MADEVPCVCKYSKYKWAVAILIVLLIAVIAYLVWKGYSMTKQSKDAGFDALRGYWHMGDDQYLMVDDALIQIIQMSSNGAIELFKIPDAKINIIDTGIRSHAFTVAGKYSPSVNKLSISGTIEMAIEPPSGFMTLAYTKNDKRISGRLIKDNAMSAVMY